MAGLTILDMGQAARCYRPSLRVSGFPAATYCQEWDQRNAKTLARYARGATDPQSPAALALSRVLAAAGSLRAPVPSMASNIARREIADSVCGHLWQLLDQLAEPAHFFTVIPRYGEIPSEDLSAFTPDLVRQRFRAELNAQGAVGSDGILFAVLEAEYQVRADQWRFHWHGCASGGKLAALDKLRQLRAYASPRPQTGDPRPDVAYRVRVARQALYNLPDPLTYCIKPWYARWMRDDGGRGRRRRLPDAVLAQALLWQHRWALPETSLLMGLRPARSGLIIINSTRMKGDEP